MSRQELAEAANAYLWERHGIVENLNGTWIGHLEQGRYHWPGARRREALRHVLGVTSDKDIGLYNPRGPLASDVTIASPPTPEGYADPDPWHAGDIDRRTMLRATITTAGWGLTATALTLDDLAHITAALEDSRRYLDSTVIGHLGQRLGACADDDGARGPRAALPGVLGVLGVVEHRSKQVKPQVRRELLRVGARAAELAGWLYRDAGMPQPADYWRDRATEWALEAGDHAMPGYILIKKSQSAWDAREALRMLTLAQAVQAGPWPLPARVRAEAIQQEARGLAMINGDVKAAQDKLDQAEELLASEVRPSDGGSTKLAAHYDASLFAVQTAMCYAEAGQPQQAVAVYNQALRPAVFSRRDYAYFISQKAQALAAARQPDEAAQAGRAALPIATAAGSMRTVGELFRLANQLRPWSDRPAVREFHALLPA
jgi:hypothetical protein